MPPKLRETDGVETRKLVCEFVDAVNDGNTPIQYKAPSQFTCPLSLHAA